MKYHTFILAGCLALLGACSQSEQGSAPATDTKVVEETAAKAAAEEAAAKVAAEEAAAKAAAEEASTPSMEEKTMMEKAEDAVDAVKSGL
ncbi:hypothetical protein BOW37_06435 [Solemya velum gill symbiont]|nr:hypothetical protein [Solemya velum gill symbiont]OOZ44421.1 hypothetical protein BOW37_06435 [Solemya velum gill symbiont]OOZ46220.1 hypothetical protein BOW38_07730 [Solemya velum gill symbiont]OOZ48798.1 hypothetical protein BOW39_08625 [Solemya velum gill symbiont]OOZ51302.1 hypothetical protein BOW40_08000 [Solemya velum gill symbiont]OOZ53855.1 hypothetical protein BOW41_08010 [Solemya velum gill symbiont]